MSRRSSGSPSFIRALAYISIVAGALLLGWYATGTSSGALAAVTLTTGLLVAGIATSRLVTLAHLGVLAWAVGGTALVAVGLHLAGAPRSPARWILASTLARSVALLPGFVSIDVPFHAHRLIDFVNGVLITSGVSMGPDASRLGIPYPPALYALLAPFVASEPEALDSADQAVRVALWLFEATVPVLVLGILRALGASTRTATTAALASAVMPEAALVLGKGIVANVFGNWSALVVVWALAIRAPGPIVLATVALAFLAHPGTTLSLAALLVAWAGYECLTGRTPFGTWLTRAAWCAGGALLAWALYYRQVMGLSTENLGVLWRWMQEDSATFFAPRWVHAGKIAQNAVLKFGGLPLALMFVGVRRSATSERVLDLVRPWLFTGAMLAVLAIVTPFALRFEYFLIPPVAMAAALGADALETKRPSWARWIAVVWGFCFALQLTLLWLILADRLTLLSVIIPSSDWSFPVRF